MVLVRVVEHTGLANSLRNISIPLKLTRLGFVPYAILIRSIFRGKRPEVKSARTCNMERKCLNLEEAEIRI